MCHFIRRLVIAAAFAALLAIALIARAPNHPVRAATLCVNTDGSGGCYSNIQAAVDAASPGDTILIGAGTYIQEAIVILNKPNLTLLGAGASRTIIQSTVWAQNSPLTVTAVTLLGFPHYGECLWNNSNVTLTDALVKGCSTGIYNAGTARIKNVAFRGCGDLRNGFAIYNWGTIHLTNVTLSNNRTFTNYGSATLTNTTITGNDVIAGGTMTLTNTIVEHCTSVGNMISLGHNLNSDASCSLNASSDITNTNPLLAPLGYFGGSTPTRALLSGSPAIDAGDDAACPTTDQRGFPRPWGKHCDIGAYEFQPFIYFFPLTPHQLP